MPKPPLPLTQGMKELWEMINKHSEDIPMLVSGTSLVTTARALVNRGLVSSRLVEIKGDDGIVRMSVGYFKKEE